MKILSQTFFLSTFRKLFMSMIRQSSNLRAPNPVLHLSDKPLPLIYIFVNPTSGGNAAASISGFGVHHFTFSEPGLQSHVFIYNIREGEHGDKPGFHDMRDRVEKHEADSTPVHVIVAGGDGTVMWAISEALAHKVDMSKVAFGVIPYGTGNDFSRSLGWGGSSPGKNIMDQGMKVFKRLVAEYLKAEVVDFDIWNASIKVASDGGRVLQVKDGKKVVMQGEAGDLKILSKPVCNYFSIGIESRVGLGFEKKRSTSTFRNKLRYVIEGLKKSVTSTPRINDLIRDCVVTSPSGSRTLFQTGVGSSEAPKLLGDPISLIFLNINSFAAGCDLWAGATKSGLVPSQKVNKQEVQSVGDQKLEILTYQRLFSLSLEQTKNSVIGGNGSRISQEEGPITVNFRDDLGSKRTYLQIDGEFFTLDKCQSVTISHGMVVKVLKRQSKK
jgi:diacylglycerol kinase (ATP)